MTGPKGCACIRTRSTGQMGRIVFFYSGLHVKLSMEVKPCTLPSDQIHGALLREMVRGMANAAMQSFTPPNHLT